MDPQDRKDVTSAEQQLLRFLRYKRYGSGTSYSPTCDEQNKKSWTSKAPWSVSGFTTSISLEQKKFSTREPGSQGLLCGIVV